MERAPSGFCLSFEPRRGRRRRTSGRGQATSTGLELLLRSMFEPPVNVFTHCVRPRVANPSGLPLARAPGVEPAALRFPPELRTPPSPAAHVRGGDRPSSTDLEQRFTTFAEPPILRVHSMRATSRRTATSRCVETRGSRPAFVLAGAWSAGTGFVTACVRERQRSAASAASGWCLRCTSTGSLVDVADTARLLLTQAMDASRRRGPADFSGSSGARATATSFAFAGRSRSQLSAPGDTRWSSNSALDVRADFRC